MRLYKSILRQGIMMICVGLTISSCSSDSETESASVGVPLQIETATVSTTRAAIETSTLPNGSLYGVFAVKAGTTEPIATGNNAMVYYENGASLFYYDKVLLEEGVDVNILAYYPWNSDGSVYLDGNIFLETESQTDYLWGSYMNEKGDLQVVNASNPKAKILFRHALARVTLKISKSKDNDAPYKYTYVGLENIRRSMVYNWQSGELTMNEGTTDILSEISGQYWLESEKDTITADFLVLPGAIASNEVKMTLDNNVLSAYLPQSVWVSGQQYTYNVTINKRAVITISKAEITPWSNNEQPGIEVGDANYKE